MRRSDDPIRLFESSLAGRIPYDPRTGKHLLILASAILALSSFVGVTVVKLSTERAVAVAESAPAMVAPREPAAASQPHEVVAHSDETRGLIQLRAAGLNRKYQSFRLPPQHLCDEIAVALKMEKQPWAKDQISGRESECLYGPIALSGDDAVDPLAQSSIFVALRGSHLGDVTRLSVKANLLDASDQAEMTLLLSRLKAATSDRADVGIPEAAWGALEAGREFDSQRSGASFMVKSEFADPRRVNLVARFDPVFEFSLSSPPDIASPGTGAGVGEETLLPPSNGHSAMLSRG